MIDIRRVRADLDGVKSAMARRHDPQLLAELDELAAADEELRTVTTERDDLRARVNAMSKEVGEAYRGGDRDKGDRLKEEGRSLGDEEKAVAIRVDELGDRVRELLLSIPNIPSDDAPDGESEAGNVVLRVEQYDEAAYGEHQRMPHW